MRARSWRFRLSVCAGLAAAAILVLIAPDFSGKNGRSAGADGRGMTGKHDRPLVESRLLRARSVPLILRLRGETEARGRLMLRAETTARVAALPVEKGAFVGEGDVICKLEEGTLETDLKEARARLAQREAELASARKLAGRNYRPKLELTASIARYEAANAQVARARRALDLTVLKAPFAGVVEDVPVVRGTLMSPRQVCAVLLDLDPPHFVVPVPRAHVEVLAGTASAATVRLETGDVLKGKVVFTAHAADAKTGNYRVEVALERPAHVLREGMTGEAEFRLGRTRAHKIPRSAMTLNDEGAAGVRIVDSNGTVRFLAGRRVGSDEETVWLAGLPPAIRLITFGQDYVRAGEKVRTAAHAGPVLSAEPPP